MATIVTRAGKGSALTYAEADANFTNLNNAKIETSAIGTTVQPYSANLTTYATVNPTAAGLSLLDDADASAQRTTLGLGTAATTASTDYATVAQGAKADTAVQPADIANVLETSDIGVSVQAYDADLDAWAAVATTAKQDTLVSGTNIKTINSSSILGSGNLVISSTIANGDKGDITVSSSGATWTIDNDAVTYAKIQNVSATDRLLGRSTAGAGDVEEIVCTAAGRALLDDVSASDQRTTLGLGTLATQSGTFSGSSSGSNTGDQNIFQTIAVSGQSNVVADSATDTLTLAAGTGVSLTTNATTDTITITNSSPDQTVALTAGTGISTSGTYPNFTITNNDLGSSQNIFKNVAVSGQSTVVADSNNDTLTLVAGTNVTITTDATTDTITIASSGGGGGGGVSDGDYGDITVSGTGTIWNIDAGVVSTTELGGDITAAGKALLDDADASAQRTTLGLGTISTQAASNVSITGGTINGTTVGATTPATGTFTSLSDSGNLTFTGTGNRITGDFSNATQANRVVFQSSTTNGQTSISMTPNGTSTSSSYSLYSDSAMANGSVGNIIINPSGSPEFRINSTIVGTGTYLPITLNTSGTERVRIATTGAIGLSGTNYGTASTQAIVSNGSASPPSWQTIVTPTDTQTLTNKTLTDPTIIGTVTEDIFTITDAAAFEINPANGSIQTITLGANRTPAATNFTNGKIVLLGINDGTAFTITWTTVAVTWVKAGGTASAPTLATTGFTWVLLWEVGGVIYGVEVGKP